MCERRRQLEEAVTRLAMLSLHTSPLVQPGGGDAGGMNVYVRELVAATVGRCGLIGTVELHDGATSVPARLTTPGRLELVEVLLPFIQMAIL